jgi:hypothetical protein
MSLTLWQLQTFKAAILADVSQTTNVATNNHIAIAAYYNGNGTGTIWRPAIPVAEIITALIGAETVALSATKIAAFQIMCSGMSIDATNANVRAAFSAIFGASTTLTNLTAIAQRTPTRFEMVFTVSQVCSQFGALVTPNDVAQALGS